MTRCPEKFTEPLLPALTATGWNANFVTVTDGGTSLGGIGSFQMPPRAMTLHLSMEIQRLLITVRYIRQGWWPS